MIASDHNLEFDLKTSQEIKVKCKSSYRYSQALYAALCNNSWCPNNTLSILKNEEWYCTWRMAGAIVAEIADDGHDYLNFYCSGSLDGEFVPEGTVTDEIREDLRELGWVVLSRA